MSSSNRSIVIRDRANGSPSPQVMINQNPVKNKKKKTKRVRRNQKQRVALNKVLTLSPCALHYLQAITDPFGYRFAGQADVCIPDLLDLPSQKLSLYGRTSFSIGTAGFGFISFNPWAINGSYNCVSTSQQTWSGTTVQSPNGSLPSGVSSIPWATSPYSGTPSTLPLYRLVAAGIRIRYTGTELNRGGIIAPVVALADNDSISGSTMAMILSRPLTSSETCDRKWHGCFYKPLTQADYQYNDMSYRIENTDAFMGIVVSGYNLNSYEAEFIAYYELTSRGGSTGKVTNTSRSDTDLMGLSIVRDAMTNLGDSALGQSAYSYAIAQAKNFAASYAQTSLQTAMHLAL